MIQDIYPRIYHNEYHDLTPKGEDFILIFHKNKVLVRFQDEKLRYPSLQEFESCIKSSSRAAAPAPDKSIFH